MGGPPPSGEGGKETGDPLGRHPGPRLHEAIYNHNMRPYTQPCGSAVARQMKCQAEENPAHSASACSHVRARGPEIFSSERGSARAPQAPVSTLWEACGLPDEPNRQRWTGGVE